MNAKMIDAMKGIRDNLSILIEEMEGNDSLKTAPVTAEATESKKETPVTPASKVAPTTPAKSRKEREASEKLPNPNDELTQEQLDGLSYNNLKRLAKEMGIPATGARDELTQKILSYDGEVPNPGAESEEETEEPVAEEKTSRKSPRKIQKSKPEPVEEEDEEEEEVDPIVEKVNEAVEDMTDEEIMDILADVGVKAKGKRQALISAVIKAVRDGKIDLDDEESEEDEDEAETEAESEEEVEYDVNDPENPDMTEERRTAIKAYEADIRADFENGDITRKQLIEWLNEFHDTKDTMKKKSDEEILSEYIHCSCLLINDEGEMPEEEGAYTVNGIPYCCGHELAYNEDNDTYICEVCGAEFEAGEE